MLVGEIGGDEEEKAARFVQEQVTKPVLAYIAGFSAPPGKTMGHAGAIISGSAGTAQAKKEALEAVGIEVGTTPTEVAQLVVDRFGAADLSAAPIRTLEAWRRSPSPAASRRRSASPSTNWPTARARRYERDGATVLSYGPVGGYQPLREWIAERHGVDPARVLATNGSLQGIAFLADTLCRPARARRVADIRPSVEAARGAWRRRVRCRDGRGGSRP